MVGAQPDVDDLFKWVVNIYFYALQIQWNS